MATKTKTEPLQALNLRGLSRSLGRPYSTIMRAAERGDIPAPDIVLNGTRPAWSLNLLPTIAKNLNILL